MNNSSSLRRILYLIRIELTDNGQNLLLMYGVLMALLLIMLLPVCFFDTYNHLSQLAQYGAVPVVFIFGSSLYTGNALSRYSVGAKGMQAFMVPASVSEKLFCSLLINLMFLVPFAIIFWQVHYAAITFANTKIAATEKQFSYMSGPVMIYACYCFFLMHSAIFLGSVYFTRFAYVKTLACMMIFLLLITTMNSAFANYLASYPGMMGAIPFGGWNIVRDSSLKVYRISFPESVSAFLYIFPVLMIAGFWYTSYQRLREKQI